VFYRDKLAFIVLLIAFFSFVWPLYKAWRHHRQPATSGNDEAKI